MTGSHQLPVVNVTVGAHSVKVAVAVASSGSDLIVSTPLVGLIVASVTVRTLDRSGLPSDSIL